MTIRNAPIIQLIPDQYGDLRPYFEAAQRIMQEQGAATTDATGADAVDPAATAVNPAAPTAYAAHSSGGVTVTSTANTDLDTTAAALATLVTEVTTYETAISALIIDVAAIRTQFTALLADVEDIRTQLNALFAQLRTEGTIRT